MTRFVLLDEPLCSLVDFQTQLLFCDNLMLLFSFFAPGAYPMPFIVVKYMHVKYCMYIGFLCKIEADKHIGDSISIVQSGDDSLSSLP